MNLILIGFKGSGKSYFGKLLAEKLFLNFIDVDSLIEQEYFCRFGEHLSCRGIFEGEGEGYFRNLESKVIFSLKEVKTSVIATGGGVVLNPQNVNLLKEIGVLVYLELPFDVLQKRGASAACIKGDFAAYYNERKKLYESCANKTFRADQDDLLQKLKVFFYGE